MSNTNKEYKDRLFKFIFGNPEHKEWTLMLYNALNGTQHQDKEMITLNTIEDAVYMGMKNDVSFLIMDMMNFYEHQSSFNPNLPMRFLVYIGMKYGQYICNSEQYNRFSSKLQKAPTPRCICFYNGIDDKEDKVVLKLSDAFDKEADVEVKVTMININYGYNKELLDSCKPLMEYAWFVDTVRRNKKATLSDAVDFALDEMPDDFLIKPLLISNRAEVTNMYITEYNAEEAKKGYKKEGREEEREKNIRNYILSMKTRLETKETVIETAAQIFNISMEQATEKVTAYWDNT